ncbi:hypothetical protein NDN08_002644 [Rhodosorus marinus]|uniref:Uncharacterized protein n=1 Tax=Rhodosorus marinus TaxID=101924 RepID=A0AAV8UUD5_9RHOD|nr:hypothetical protein NDN08_002644 [Rhodosorus marinus]
MIQKWPTVVKILKERGLRADFDLVCYMTSSVYAARVLQRSDSRLVTHVSTANRAKKSRAESSKIDFLSHEVLRACKDHGIPTLRYREATPLEANGASEHFYKLGLFFHNLNENDVTVEIGIRTFLRKVVLNNQRNILVNYLIPLRNQSNGMVKLMLPPGGLEELDRLIEHRLLKPETNLGKYVRETVDLSIPMDDDAGPAAM